MKAEIRSLLLYTVKIFQPFLRYFFKLTFPTKQPQHFFHIFSVDIELDKDGNPVLLEVNSNPSIKVEYDSEGPVSQKTPRDYLERQEAEKLVFTPTCDLHIKSM